MLGACIPAQVSTLAPSHSPCQRRVNPATTDIEDIHGSHRRIGDIEESGKQLTCGNSRPPSEHF
jgi:hypothetical protein